MGSSAKHLSAAVQQPIGARSQDRIIKELQQQHGFSSLQVRRLGSAEAKKQATFFLYLMGKQGFNRFNLRISPLKLCSLRFVYKVTWYGAVEGSC